MASRSRSRRSARSSSTVSPGRVAVGLAIPAVIIVVAVVVGFGDGGEDDAPSSRSASSTSTTSTTSTSTTEPREPIERTGSREVDGGAPIDVGGGPDRYRLVYWVTHADGLVNEESLVVDRPFLSETITTRDGEVVGRSRSAFGLVLEGADDSRAVAIGPALAGGDLRLAIGVDVAVSSGTLEVREQREVAGRRCQVYRAATSVITGSLEGVPTSDDHADACFDADGLLLEEWWVVDGRPLRHRVAVEVGTDVPDGFGAGWADVVPALGTFVEAGADDPPAFTLGIVPDGFVPMGRYRTVVGLASDAGGSGGGGTMAEVWQRGSDLLVVEHGPPPGAEPYVAAADAEMVDVAGVGAGEIVVGLRFAEVRFGLADGSFLRVIATLPRDELVSLTAAALRPSS